MTFDPNEQRDQSGKWTAGGVGGKTGPADVAKRIEQMNEDARRIGLAAKAVATELGYDPEKISVRTDDKTFTLNGKSRYYAGAAYLDGSGRIELFSKQLAPSSVGPTTAHEIGHQKFQNFFDDYQAEYKRMSEDTKDIDVDEYMKPNGLLKEGWVEKYPLYQKYTEVMQPSITEEFSVSDGITPYSEEWWAAWKAGKAQTMQAFHETIAEMTAREYVQGPNYEQESVKFKEAGYSLDMGHDYSVRKWKTDIKVDPKDLPPNLRTSFEKLTQGLTKRKNLFWGGSVSYKRPAPEWVKLYDAVNAHWDSKHK